MASTNKEILNYQQKCFNNYAHSVGLPNPYMYPNGNRIRPLPPVQTAKGGLMIIGAYPSARFESQPSQLQPGRYHLVPIADNLEPFGCERYFDGLRVRTLESADGLNKYLLDKLPLSFSQCWITDTVKVFLYKPEHVASCRDAYPEYKVPELRSHFLNLAQKSLPWIEEECDLCKPKLILTLGEEVAQVISNRLNLRAGELLSSDVWHSTLLGPYPTMFAPHPDACRRSEKWRMKMAVIVETIKRSFDL